jgi:hypothetical protein
LHPQNAEARATVGAPTTDASPATFCRSPSPIAQSQGSCIPTTSLPTEPPPHSLSLSSAPPPSAPPTPDGFSATSIASTGSILGRSTPSVRSLPARPRSVLSARSRRVELPTSRCRSCPPRRDPCHPREETTRSTPLEFLHPMPPSTTTPQPPLSQIELSVMLRSGALPAANRAPC